MSESRAVLFEYFTTKDSTLLFVVRADFKEPKVIEIPITLEKIQQFVTFYFGTGNSINRITSLDAGEWEEQFGALVNHIKDWADEGDIVWLVPHELLHYLPLHSLRVEGRHLIERNPVCYTPSASVMKYCRNNRKGRRERALIFADSRTDRPMMYAREQAFSIQSLLKGNAEIHLGDQATKALLKQRMGKASEEFDILHLACHGYFHPRQALKSGIMLAPENSRTSQQNEQNAPEQGDEIEWNLTAEEIFSLEMRVNLVTLSACESGVNERQSGDELIGLTRSLIYAGTPSIIVSLWAVDNLSTSIMMAKFYEELIQLEATKVEALQSAQLYLKNLSIDGALQYIEKMRSRDEGDSQLSLNLDITKAEMLLVARDYAAAQSAFQALLNLPSLDSKSRHQARAGVEKARLFTRADITPDYDRHPYDDLYYWAPFILVGDWK